MTDPRYPSVTDPDETSPISADRLAELRESADGPRDGGGREPASRGDRTVAGGPPTDLGSDRAAPGGSRADRAPRESTTASSGAAANGSDRSARPASNGSPGASPASGGSGWYDQQRYPGRLGDSSRDTPRSGSNGYPPGSYPGSSSAPGAGRDTAGRDNAGRDGGAGGRLPGSVPGAGRSGRPETPPTTGSTPTPGPAGARSRSAPPDAPYSPYGSASGGGYGAATGYPSGGTPAAGAGAGATSSLYGGGSAYSPAGSSGAGYGGSEATNYAPGGYSGSYGPSSYSTTVGRDLDSTGTGMTVGGAAGAVGAGSFVGGSTLGTSPSRRPAGRQPRGGAAGRPARRARLMIKQVDPWSTFKFSLVLAVAMFFVWLVAIGVLYGVLNGIGVFNKINDLYSQLAGSNGKKLITPGLVLGLAALVGAVNIVLTTALATVGAFVYNICSDLVGGIEVTLAERD